MGEKSVLSKNTETSEGTEYVHLLTSVHIRVLKTDEDVVFHTGLNGKGTFCSFHDYIAPFVKRRWKGVSRVVNKVRRAIIRCQTGSCRKLDSRDEFLLTLMRLIW